MLSALKLKSLAKNILNSGYDEAGTPHVLMFHIRTLNIIDILLMLVSVPFICLELYYGLFNMAIFSSLISIADCVKLLLLRRYQRVILFGHGTIFLYIASLVICLIYLGNFFDTIVAWALLTPALVALLTNFRGLLFYSAITLAILIGYYYLSLFSLVPILNLPSEFKLVADFLNQLFTLIIFYFILARFLSLRAQIESKLIIRNHALNASKHKCQRLLNFDSLTQAYNQQPFIAELKKFTHANRAGYRLVLAYLDLDDFKTVNDRYGTSVGDEILRQAVNRLQKTLKTGDLVARIHNDEFVLFFSGIKPQDKLENITKRISKVFQKDFIVDKHQIKMTASIGLAVYPYDTESENSLLNNAYHAMLDIKESGGNNHKFYQVAKSSDGDL